MHKVDTMAIPWQAASLNGRPNVVKMLLHKGPDTIRKVDAAS